MAQERIEEM